MLEIDFHIHSVNSGHAYANYYQIVEYARKNNMKMIAITDHGPSMNGTLGWLHFVMGHRQPKFDDIKVLWGVELNVIDSEGIVDLPDKILKKLDIVILGFHKGDCPYVDLGYEKNTEAFLKALENPYIQIISHPTNHQFHCDWRKIAEVALEKGILLEFNLSWFRKFLSNEEKKNEFKELVQMVRSKGAKMIVNGDSHFLHEIGDDSALREHWDFLEMSDDIILNNNIEELKEKLKLN